MRGIVYGQDQQLWYRPLAQPGENTTAGLVLTGPDEGALSDQVIEEVLSRARADDILGPYGGATRDGNHLLFLNLKNYTGMEDAEFLARIERMIDDVQSAGDIDKHIGTFYAEEMNGTPAYLRALAGDPTPFVRPGLLSSNRLMNMPDTPTSSAPTAASPSSGLPSASATSTGSSSSSTTPRR
jgi:hypothetical protein